MATSTVESLDLDVYYDEKDPEVGKQARDLLVNYSGVAPGDLVPHIRAVRDQAWKLFKYPCVGKYYFLDFSICKSDKYASVLERLQHGETMLDAACCFGQDCRKAIYDGAPAANVYGSELQQGFLDLGFQLFRDEDKLAGHFSSGDIFSDDVAGQEGKAYDMIHAASFIHLFSWAEQVEVVTRLVRLLKPKAGSMIFGRQTAVKKAAEIEHPASRSGLMYRHDMPSFKKLVDHVASATDLTLEVNMSPQDDAEKLDAELGWYRISFDITIR